MNFQIYCNTSTNRNPNPNPNPNPHLIDLERRLFLHSPSLHPAKLFMKHMPHNTENIRVGQLADCACRQQDLQLSCRRQFRLQSHSCTRDLRLRRHSTTPTTRPTLHGYVEWAYRLTDINLLATTQTTNPTRRIVTKHYI